MNSAHLNIMSNSAQYVIILHILCVQLFYVLLLLCCVFSVYVLLFCSFHFGFKICFLCEDCVEFRTINNGKEKQKTSRSKFDVLLLFLVIITTKAVLSMADRYGSICQSCFQKLCF